MPNVIDLFAGPGGLAEGFSSLHVNGARQFNIRLSVEKDQIPYQTLKLRAFFRTFLPGQAPAEYYDFIAGRITIDALYRAYPDHLEQAEEDALQTTLGACSHDWLDARITRAINGDHNWVLIGGPPCQAYSIAGIVGNRTKKDYCQTTDPRFFLYREYLRVVAVHAPSVFVMENVKGLLTAKDNGRSIAENVMRGLSNPTEFMQQEYGQHIDAPRYRLYALNGEELPEDGNHKIFLVHCEKYGIPQARHRVIIIGIREDISPDLFAPPAIMKTTDLDSVIGDLPVLRSGISRNIDSLALWIENLVGILESGWLIEAERLHGTTLGNSIRQTIHQLENTRLNTGAEWLESVSVPQWNPDWYHDPRMQGTCHHEARPHILSDLHRYLFCSSFTEVFGRSPKMHDFPESLLPKHENAKSGHFKDRFRVQIPHKPASTVISHLNKDGHAYIHPDPFQCRSITPREAARIQTFPDNYFFFGGRSHQYRQIGNAVPPWLALTIAKAISPLIPT